MMHFYTQHYLHTYSMITLQCPLKIFYAVAVHFSRILLTRRVDKNIYIATAMFSLM